MTISTKILLKIKDSKFYYTDNDFIDIKNTNIPFGKMSFSYGREVFWEVELFDFDNETKTVRVRVLDYSPKNKSSYYDQKRKKLVKFFLFEKFQWSKLEPQLSFYQRSELSDIIDELPITTRNNEFLEFEERFKNSDRNLTGNPEFSPHNKNFKLTENQIIKIDEEISFFFKNANFKDGFVSIDFKPKLCSKKEEIKILNKNILREYDYVKNYFPKYFKKGKKFKVRLRGEIQLGKLINYEATSEEIQSIDEDVISEVRSLSVVEMFDNIDTGKFDKSVLSIEDLIKKSDLNSTIKESIEKEPYKILHSILKRKDVKNKKQLEYLAGFKHKGNRQLRFTLKPLFGFLFYVESGGQNHFCWELLNSHATYIWSFDSKLDFYEKLNDIDNIINYIRINGRIKYRQFEKSGGEKKFAFSILYHKNKLNKFKDGFVEWKNELEKIMTKPVANKQYS